jgi:RNA polymerase sigma-70 factor, ECF subfamily
VPDETDEQLMLGFQRGDVRAFETLMRRHRTLIHTFLCRQVGDRARAEDLTQEAFLRMIKARQDWEPRASVRTWLFTIARHLATDEARRQVHRQARPLEASGPGEEGAVAVRDEGRAPDDAAADRELRPLLERALAALPDEQREVFLLREHMGLSFPEIATATGVNENTVKSRMRYALLALRDRLVALGVVTELPSAALPRLAKADRGGA